VDKSGHRSRVRPQSRSPPLLGHYRVRDLKPRAVLEDAWVGGTLVFGDSDAKLSEPPTVVRLNQNNAGVYVTVMRSVRVRVGDRVRLVAETLQLGRERENPTRLLFLTLWDLMLD
jgi:hypothetical protein